MAEEITPEQRQEWQDTLDQWQAINYGYPDIRDTASELHYLKSCIITKPQNIRFELNNGNAILKSGSILYMPNGVGIFDIMNITADKAVNVTGFGSGTYFLFVNEFGYTNLNSLNSIVSGETDSLAGQTYHTWYNTTNNVINRYTTNTSTPAYKLSFPIAIITILDDIISSIDQVFNHIGYIGSTLFALPGINAKYYWNNNERTYSTTNACTYTNTTETSESWFSLNNNNSIVKQNKIYTEYNVFKNRVMSKVSDTTYAEAILGELKYTNGKISEFNQF